MNNDRFPHCDRSRKRLQRKIEAIPFICGLILGVSVWAGETDKPFLGISYRPVSSISSANIEGTNGLFVVRVLPDSAAQIAGIKAGDIIVSYDSRTFAKIASPDFAEYIQSQKQVGDLLSLIVLRPITSIRAWKDGRDAGFLQRKALDKMIHSQSPGERLTYTVDKRYDRLGISVRLGARPAADDTQSASTRYHTSSASDPFVDLMERRLSDYELIEDFKAFRESLTAMENDAFCTDLLRHALAHPTTFHLTAMRETQKLEATAKQSDIDQLLLQSATIVDMVPVGSRPLPFNLTLPLPPTTPSQDDHLRYLRHITAVARKYLEQAYHQLSGDEMNLLADTLPAMMERRLQGCNLDAVAQEMLTPDEWGCLAVAHEIDFEALLHSAQALAMLLNRTWLTKLQHTFLNRHAIHGPPIAGATGEILYAEKSASGLVIIGGTGPNRYDTGADIIIDLGGDDVYTAGGSGITPDRPIRLIIDLNGNDRYSASAPFSLGCGFMGVGILADLGGDDHYTGTQFSQGAALFGIGILIDTEGDDIYEAQERSQGVAYWGMGILMDKSGADTYHAHLLSQGAGGPKGLGLLVDLSGNDRYYASGKHPSCYGDPGVFQGLSQGFGFGFRGVTAGGIGVLLDLAGRDHFDAGTFSQGGGYAGGLGILKNGGIADDEYFGTRYGQGFGAHAAAGILIECGGDDHYGGLTGALQAAAWDKSVAILLDLQGNDLYDTRHLFFSQAAAAHNSFALLLDEAGRDRYLYPKGLKAGDNSYHGGHSFSFFIDNGGDSDDYGDGFSDNREKLEGEYGIMIDIGKDLRKDYGLRIVD